MSAGVREGPGVSTAYGRPVLPVGASVNAGASSFLPLRTVANSLSGVGSGTSAGDSLNTGSSYGYGIASGVCMGLGLLAARAWRRRKKVAKEKPTLAAVRGRSDSVSSSGRSVSIKVGSGPSAHRVRSSAKSSTAVSTNAVAAKSLPNATAIRTSQNDTVPGSPAALPLDFDLLKNIKFTYITKDIILKL